MDKNPGQTSMKKTVGNMKETDLSEQLFPGQGKLKVEEDSHSAIIVDAELDPIRCSFEGDESVTIDTKKLTYIKLTKENLLNLYDLIEESEILLYG